METTLYDKDGKPVAYIVENDDCSIYLLSGHAVAYVDSDVVYSWNGHQLGWFIDGIIYDLHGQRVGFIRGKCPVSTYAEPAKYAKSAEYAKYARCAHYARPALSSGFSKENLETFLKSGAVG